MANLPSDGLDDLLFDFYKKQVCICFFCFCCCNISLFFLINVVEGFEVPEN
jgi:hypothetical protein